MVSAAAGRAHVAVSVSGIGIAAAIRRRARPFGRNSDRSRGRTNSPRVTTSPNLAQQNLSWRISALQGWARRYSPRSSEAAVAGAMQSSQASERSADKAERATRGEDQERRGTQPGAARFRVRPRTADALPPQ